MMREAYMEYIEKNWKKLLTLLIVTMLVIGGAVSGGPCPAC